MESCFTALSRSDLEEVARIVGRLDWGYDVAWLWAMVAQAALLGLWEAGGTFHEHWYLLRGEEDDDDGDEDAKYGEEWP
jgi:hypothetical protein